MFRAIQELTTEWYDRRVWYSAAAAEGCQNWLAGSISIEGFEVVLRIPQWTYYLLTGPDSLLQLQHYKTHGDHTTQSSAPDDGHGIARNMLSSL